MEVVKLNSARNCLRYLIKAFCIKEIYIPYYLCSCIRHAIFEEGCKINFYHINLDFSPSCDFPKDAYILYPNYWGICSYIVEKLAKKYPNLIVDNAHSFYSKHLGIASFNSLRKFFPEIRDGAFLYTQKTVSFNFPDDEYFYSPKKLDYYGICKNENRINNLEIKFMSDATFKLFSKISLVEEKIKRRSYFDNLVKIYNSTNLLKINIKTDDIPYCYPYLASSEKEADELVKELKNKGLIIYRYWDNMPDSFLEKNFYKCLVAIPLTIMH